VTVIAVQAAADAAPSAMVSVIGLDSDKVAALCDAANEEVSEDERVQIANFLCPVSWLIYLFFCFSFTSGVVIGIIHIYVKVPMVLLYEEHGSLAASMNPVRKNFYSSHPATEMQQKGNIDDLVTIAIWQGNYAVSGGVKGVEAVEAKAKSFKARMTVNILTFISLSGCNQTVAWSIPMNFCQQCCGCRLARRCHFACDSHLLP
jgi:hypothetical protein